MKFFALVAVAAALRLSAAPVNQTALGAEPVNATALAQPANGTATLGTGAAPANATSGLADDVAANSTAKK